MRILLVEDDKKIASFVMKRLKEAAFAVDHVDNGADGLQRALHQSYDAAVVDIMLPKLDGLSMIERMRLQEVLSLESINLAALIDEVAELYDCVAEEKGIQLSTSAPNDLYLRGDRVRLRQVLANLLDNAVKYTPSGGRIDIEASKSGQQAVLFVKDSGIGIPLDEVPRIWDPLYRGDKSRSQRGLGLGLSLVKAVVQAHQGQVEASANPSGGSVFSVYLPLLPAA